MLPADDMHGAAHALLAKRLGLKSVYLVHEDSEFWPGFLLPGPFRYAARRLGVPHRRHGRVRPRGAKRYDALADRIARSGADGRGARRGPAATAATELLKALRARLGARCHDPGRLLLRRIVPEVLKLRRAGGARAVRGHLRPASRPSSS